MPTAHSVASLGTRRVRYPPARCSVFEKDGKLTVVAWIPGKTVVAEAKVLYAGKVVGQVNIPPSVLQSFSLQ